VAFDFVGKFRHDSLVGELVDVALRQRRLDIIVGGRASAEDLGGQFVSARVVWLELCGRDRHVDILIARFEDRLRERDILADTGK
jgi:hypothetical protein